MHLGRFHAAVNEVVVAFGEEQTLGKYDNFINTLQASVSDPNNASQAQVFRTSWEELRTTLSDSALNRMSPLRQRIFEELEISSAYGVGMRDKIEAILREQNATPALALGQLTELRKEFQAVHTSLLSIDKEFSKLHVEYEELSAGEAEVGFSVPESFAKKRDGEMLWW